MKRLTSKLPPHKALLAFEAVLRLGTVTAAARELTSTQPAISQHLKTLEGNLNKVLFSRRGRLLQPTEAAYRYYNAIEPLLTKLAEASEHLRQDIDTQNCINIISNSGLAHFWLLPMLPALQAKFPEMSITVTLSDAPHLVSENALVMGFDEINTLTKDLQYSRGQGVQRTLLFAEEVCAVCSADYAIEHQLDRQSSIEDILKQPLIHMDEFDNRWLNWSDWLQFFGYKQQKIENLVFLGNYYAVISAAQAGQGVSLGWRCLMQHLLDQDILVQVSDSAIKRPQYGYFIDTQHASTANYKLVSDYLIYSAQNIPAYQMVN